MPASNHNSRQPARSTEAAQRFVDQIVARKFRLGVFDCDGTLAPGKMMRVPTGTGKGAAIREVIGRPVNGVIGNSMRAAAMPELAGNPCVINPNPDLEAFARARHWPIYWRQSLARTADKACIA